MKKLIKYPVIVLVASLFAGCATNSDIANIQSQIDGLNVQVAQVSTDAQFASESAIKAQESSNSALKYAEAAAQLSHDAELKIDALFTQTMMK